jgi:hypothetical protein
MAPSSPDRSETVTTKAAVLDDGQSLRDLLREALREGSEVDQIDDARGVPLATRWGRAAVFVTTLAGQERMRADVEEGLWPK